MEGSNFLDNLKNAVDKGEFNSEAAKKIIEIDKLADEKKNSFGLTQDRLEKSGFAEAVSEEEAIVLNSEYEKEMEKIKKQDAVNKQLATLIEIENMVKASIDDMSSFVDELEQKFEKEFKEGDQMFAKLYTKLAEIKIKYNSNINN